MGIVELDLTNIQIPTISGQFPSNNWLINIRISVVRTISGLITDWADRQNVRIRRGER
jgi:hypothetical protein